MHSQVFLQVYASWIVQELDNMGYTMLGNTKMTLQDPARLFEKTELIKMLAFLLNQKGQKQHPRKTTELGKKSSSSSLGLAKKQEPPKTSSAVKRSVSVSSVAETLDLDALTSIPDGRLQKIKNLGLPISDPGRHSIQAAQERARHADQVQSLEMEVRVFNLETHLKVGATKRRLQKALGRSQCA